MTIIIGKDNHKKRVRVAAALLSTQSFYFNKACAEPWKRPGKTLQLPEETPETFEIFLAWLNTGDIKHASSLSKIGTSNDAETRRKDLSSRWLQLLHCYSMADYIQAPRYMNAIMDALIATLEDFDTELSGSNEIDEVTPMCDTCVRTINLVWERTPTKSPLRVLVIDTLCSNSNCSLWSKIPKIFIENDNPQPGSIFNVPQDFIADILGESLDRAVNSSRNVSSWDCSKKIYHVEEKLP